MRSLARARAAARWVWPAAACLLLAAAGASPAATPPEDDDFELAFQDDTPRLRGVEHPAWFKESFLDLPEDVREVRESGKRALMVYFGQPHCAYCEALMEVNFKHPEIVAYTRQHFDVIALNIWGDREVTTTDGVTMSEKALALRERTNFTPSIIFYDTEGKEVFRLRGYYPPYRFRAALEYVADGHYREESFRDYLARADPPPKFDPEELSDEPFFVRPPYVLDRRRFPAQHPLVVFFEQGKCHACDVLHTEPLSDPRIRELLDHFEAVQLDMWSDTPLITPDGRRSTARAWAAELGLFYAPSLVFFDERGREIIRLDSVARFFRLDGVMRFVLTRGYLRQPNYQRWREDQGMAGRPSR